MPGRKFGVCKCGHDELNHPKPMFGRKRKCNVTFCKCGEYEFHHSTTYEGKN